MFQVLAAGGWVMPLIMVCSVLALAICIERHFALNKQRIAPPHLLATVWQQLRGEGLDAQKLKALRQGSPLGMISVFTEITTHGTGNANALAGGISEALLTTAAGLAVAIPALVMHRHYTARIESIVVDLEREAIKLVDALHSNQKTEYDL